MSENTGNQNQLDYFMRTKSSKIPTRRRNNFKYYNSITCQVYCIYGQNKPFPKDRSPFQFTKKGNPATSSQAFTVTSFRCKKKRCWFASQKES